MTLNHFKMQTTSGAQLNLDALYQVCPQCFTESKDPKTGEIKHTVDFEKLRLLLGDNIAEGDERYDFTWVGKRAALQEAAKPIRKTLRPCPEESVDWDNTKNLYIEGDNLEVLKLLQNSYMGKVKMIYIDPPYNTGNDFVYQDDYHQTKQDYDLFSGDVTDEGERLVRNTESNGRFHSDWCSMIYSRLMIARSLLTEDGFICISINENEIVNLRKICDEVFGATNLLSQIVWKNKYGAGGGTNGVASIHEYILIYTKNELQSISCSLSDELADAYKQKDEKYMTRGGFVTQPLASTSKGARANLMYTIHHNGEEINPPKGGRWIWSKEKFDEAYANNEIVINKTKDGFSVRFKQYLYDEDGNKRKGTPLSLISDIFNQEGTKEFSDLFSDKRIFDFPKPTKLIRKLLDFQINETSNKDALIVDFFSGSATTAHAVMQLNAEDNGSRRFIMVQWPEKTDEMSEAYKSGYKNICEIGKERIRRAGKKILEEQKAKQADLFTEEHNKLDVGFRVFKCADSNMKDVYYTPAEYSQELLLGLEDNIKEDRNDLDLLFGCMLDWGVTLDLPLRTEKVDGVTIHIVNEGDLVACFDQNISETAINRIASLLPMRVVLRDNCFKEAKEKMNFFEIFKQRTGWSEDEVRKNVKVI